MKQRISKKNSRLKQYLSLITVLSFYSYQLIAAPEDHGRWYSVDGGGSSFLDTLGVIIMCIIGLPVAFIFAKEWLSGNLKEDNTMGCMSVAVIVVFVIFVLVKCS